MMQRIGFVIRKPEGNLVKTGNSYKGVTTKVYQNEGRAKSTCTQLGYPWSWIHPVYVEVEQ